MWWMSTEDVLMKLATVIVDDDSWCYFEISEENFEWVYWRIMWLHYFESAVDGAVDGENAGPILNDYGTTKVLMIECQ